MEEINKYLGLARNAGYIIIGSDKLNSYKKKIYLILIDNLAGKSSQKVANKFIEKNISVKYVDNLAIKVNISNCKIIGIKNKSLSDKIESLI